MGVCTRAKVIFCALDPLFFFCPTKHLPTLPFNPLSSRLFVSSLFIPRLNLRSQPFFLLDPFPSLSVSSFLPLYLLSSLRIYATEGTARGTRHIISLITPGDLF